MPSTLTWAKDQDIPQTFLTTMMPAAPPFRKSGKLMLPIAANVKPIVSNERFLCVQRRIVVRQPGQDDEDLSSVSFSAN